MRVDAADLFPVRPLGLHPLSRVGVSVTVHSLERSGDASGCGEKFIQRMRMGVSVFRFSTKFSPSWCRFTLLIASTPFFLFPYDAGVECSSSSSPGLAVCSNDETMVSGVRIDRLCPEWCGVQAYEGCFFDVG